MNRQKYLTLSFYIFGLGNILTSIGIPIFFGDELLWKPRNLATDLMVGSLYMAMGVIMLLIAKQPNKHKAFIDFIVVGNVLHAFVMILFAQKPGHIVLDSGYILMMGIIPLLLYPWPRKRFLRY